MPGPDRHLGAILSADIAGYSRFMAENEDLRDPRLQAVLEGMGLAD